MVKQIDMSEVLNKRKDFRTYASTNKLIDSNVRLGVEIELENFVIEKFCATNPYWEGLLDDSLRGVNAMEARFTVPLSGKDVDKALHSLEVYVKKSEQKPIVSNRTSTHIHIDVGDLTPMQIYKWLAAYISVERVLYRYCGAERENSCFCVPFFKSEAMLEDINNLFNRKIENKYEAKHLRRELERSYSEDVRYAGLNLNALSKLGTLEFRMLGGEWRKHKILEWINILLLTRKYGVDKNMEEVELHKHISIVGGESYIKEVFGVYADKLLYGGCNQDIMQGVRLAQDIVVPPKSLQTYWEVLQEDKKYPSSRQSTREEVKQEPVQSMKLKFFADLDF